MAPRLSPPARTALALAAGLAIADTSIVTLGLPSILLDLDTSVEGVALVLGVYTAVLALTLPLAARIRGYGPARLATGGMAVFGLASLGCGLSGSLGALLVLRAVQAVGGAAALVATFDLLDGGRPGPGRRLWVVAAVFGAAAGPALGGALTEAFDWRAIFLAQVPLVVPGALAAWITRPADEAVEELETAAPSPLPAPSAIALALLSAALTAVIFLVVLLLVAGWSVAPLEAALAVSVLPLSALLAARIPGEPHARAVAGCLLVAGGVGCLTLLPSASPLWTIAPQILAGSGMGLAVPALAGGLIRERSRGDAARLLAIRHAGIALALAALAPIVSASLDSSVAEARERGTAVVLDARLPPEVKIELAPQLLADVEDTEDPRGELERSLADAGEGLEGGEAAELDRAGELLDDVLTDGVESAFRVAFVVTAALALVAALTLLAERGELRLRSRRLALGGAAAVSAAALAAYAVADAGTETERVVIADPCQERELPGAGGIGGLFQDVSLAALDRAACEFGSSREELLLALFNDELRDRFEDEYEVDPRSITELGPALLGL
jgi:MFS family permease